MAFPTTFTNAQDTVTEIVAAHINNLETKVGIDNSLDTNSLDYMVRHAAGVYYLTSFTNGNLSSGILTVVHSLSTAYGVPTILDNNGKVIVPDEVTFTGSTSQFTVDLSSYGTIIGTWQVLFIPGGGTVQTIPQALGVGDSPTFAGETLTGLTASLPVFTGASKELVSKSVADTRTALGITALGLLANGAANLKPFMNAAGNGVEWAGGISRVEFSWDISTTGTQSITGVGFKPKVVIFLMSVSATPMASIGFDFGGSGGGLNLSIANYHSSTANAWAPSQPLTAIYGSGVHAIAYITTMDSDGFTITKSKNGSPTGTATVMCLCFR